MRKILRKVVPILLLSLLILTSGGYIYFQSSGFQRKIVERAELLLSQQLKTNVHLGGVDIGFRNQIILEDILVEDRHQDTLLYVHRLDVRMSLFALLSKRVKINRLGFEEALVNTSRAAVDSLYNFQFLLGPQKSVAVDSATSSWKLELSTIEFQRITLHHSDQLDSVNAEYAGRHISMSIDSLGEEGGAYFADINFNQFQLSLELLTTHNGNVDPLDSPGLSASRPLLLWENLGMNLPQISIRDIRFVDGEIMYEKSVSDLDGLDAQSIMHVSDLNCHLSIDFTGPVKIVTLTDGSFRDQVNGLNISGTGIEFVLMKDSLLAKLRTLHGWGSTFDGLARIDLPATIHIDSLFKKMKVSVQADTLFMDMAIAADLTDIPSWLKDMSTISGSGVVAIENEKMALNNLRLKLGDRLEFHVLAVVSGYTDPETFSFDVEKLLLKSSFDELRTIASDFGYSFANELNGTLEIETTGYGRPDDFRTSTSIKSSSINGNVGGSFKNILNWERSEISIDQIDLKGRFTDISELLNDSVGLVVSPLEEFTIQASGLKVGDSLAFTSQLTSDIISFSGRVEYLRMFTEPGWKLSIDELEIQSRGIDALQHYSYYQYFQNAGYVLAQGALSTSEDWLSADLDVRTGVGNLVSDLTLREEGKNKFILGSLDLLGFSPGEVVEELCDFGPATLKSKFEGSFGTEGLAISDLELIIEKASYKQYSMTQALISAEFQDSVLTAAFSNQDRVFDLSIDGELDLKNQKTTLNGTIDQLDLFALGIVEDSTVVSGSLAVYVDRWDLNTAGYARVEDFTFRKGNRALRLDSGSVTVENLDNAKSIDLVAGPLVGHVAGSFDLAMLIDSISQWVREFDLTRIPTSEHNDTQDFVSRQEIEFSIEFERPLVKLAEFFPDIEIQGGTKISGHLDLAGNQWDLDVFSPKLDFRGVALTNLMIKAETSPGGIVSDISIDEINLPDNPASPGLKLSGTFRPSAANFRVVLSEEIDENFRYNLDLSLSSGYVADTLNIRFTESSLQINDKAWEISESTHISIAAEYLAIDNLELGQQGQKFRIFTPYPDFDPKRMNLEIVEFELGYIGAFLSETLSGYSIDGILTGNVSISNILKPADFLADLDVTNMAVNDYEFGRMTIELEKSGPSRPIMGYVTIADSTQLLRASGRSDYPTGSNFEVNVLIDRLELAKVQPFVDDYISSVSGNLNGQLSVTGSAEDLLINGGLVFSGLNRITLESLGANILVTDQTLLFQDSVLQFSDFVINDVEGGVATINGQVAYREVKGAELDLNLSSPGFKVMDLAKENNPEFYGTIRAGAEAVVRGALDALSVSGVFRTQPKSDLTFAFVPSTAMEEPEFIRFVDLQNSDQVPDLTAAASEIIDISRFQLNAELFVSKENNLKVIIDPANGDYLQLAGEGRFKTVIDSDGEINVQGTYTISQGNYFFTLLNLIKKDFVIESGTIEWNGLPENAILDIKSVYTARTPQINLIGHRSDEMSDYDLELASRFLPVKVILYLKGDINSPEISFDIEVPATASTNLNELVGQEINKLKLDQNELNKQVLSIVMLNQFVPPETGSLDVSSLGVNPLARNVNTSVSRLLTSELNKVTSKYLGGVELSVNLQTIDNSALPNLKDQQVQVELSKALWKDKLQLRAGGSSELTDIDASEVFGNFEIQYLVDKRGNLTVRIFNKVARDKVTATQTGQQGISLKYVRSFNDILGKGPVN